MQIEKFKEEYKEKKGEIMQYKQKTELQDNKFTIASDYARNQARTNNQLGINSKTQSQNNNIQFQQKMKLKVYLSDDGRIFIDKSAAYHLGYVDVKAIMLNNIQKVEITDRQLSQIKARENIEIEYEKLVSNKEIPEKPKIEVFIDNIDYYIAPSAAYALNLIPVERFNYMADNKELYKISENLLVLLKNKYNVQYTEIDNQNKKSK